MFGLTGVHDYYAKASSKPYLPKITIPTLMVSAKNDPFLGQACFPFDIANDSRLIFLEAPKQGGHIGFPSLFHKYWPAKRVMKFWDE